MITAALDTIVAQIQAVFPTTLVTRDPGQVRAPCIHVGLPTITSSTLAGALDAEVPVYAVGTAPGDQAGMDPVLDMVPGLLRCLGVRESSPVVLEIGEQVHYPAYRAVARIKARKEAP